MSNPQPDRPRRFFIFFLLMTVIGLGCLCPVLPTVTPAVNPTKTLPPSPTEEPTVRVPDQPEIQTTGGDAWLLILTDQGLYASNPDGSGLRQLTDANYWGYDLQPAVQPNGNLVAFISPADDDIHHMALNLIKLPEGNITKVTDLTSPETEAYADAAYSGEYAEALRAVRRPGSLAWSPDGNCLSFVGVMDGPSSEVYTYFARTGGVVRSSNDDDENYALSWSPDATTLMYFTTKGFGSGAGFETTGVWMSPGFAESSIRFETPLGGAVEMVGWLDDSTALIDTWTPERGSGDLRRLDISDNQSVSLAPGAITGAAANSHDGTALYADDSGIYLISGPKAAPYQLSQLQVDWIEPVDPAEYYFTVMLADDTLATYGNDTIEHLEAPVKSNFGSVQVSMYGFIWAWTNDDDLDPGVWITGPDMEIGRIYDGPASFPIWDLNSNLIFFAQESTNGWSLMRTTFDAYYSDLTNVAYIEATVRDVAWLGWF